MKWIKTQENLPKVPTGKDFIEVMAFYPEHDKPVMMEYWENPGNVGTLENGDETNWFHRELLDAMAPPLYWMPLPAPPKIEKPHLYDIYLSDADVLEGSVVLRMNVVDITTATHEIEKGVHSFKAYSLQEAAYMAKDWLEKKFKE